MKIRLLTLFAASFVALALARANDDYGFKAPFSETHPLAANGEVSLENVNGSVDIRTWDKNEIKIEGEKSAKTEEELKLIELTIDSTPGEVIIKAKLPKRPGGWWGRNNIHAAVKFVVTVPATAHLRKIDTVNSAVTITGVRGTVTANTVNGGITAQGLGADAQLHTVNGTIRAAFATLGREQEISVETVNGSTSVSLPKGAAFELQASTVNGSVSCDFPIKLEGKSRRSRLSGTVGDGGATLKASTVNGSIRILEL